MQDRPVDQARTTLSRTAIAVLAGFLMVVLSCTSETPPSAPPTTTTPTALADLTATPMAIVPPTAAAPEDTAPEDTAPEVTAPPIAPTQLQTQEPTRRLMATQTVSAPAPTVASTPIPSALPPKPPGSVVQIGEASFRVDVAVTGAERSQGLSGRATLEPDTGMLFVYDSDGPRTFWMPDMHFPLDMIWILSDCVVNGVTANVPNPPASTPRDQLPRYPSDGPVRFVLELNAGQAAAHGITKDDKVQFIGGVAGVWGC